MPLNCTTITRLLTAALLLCSLLLSSLASADRGSHITLDEPLPQPEWALPIIANGEGTLTATSNLGRVTYVDFWASCMTLKATTCTAWCLLDSTTRPGMPLARIW